MNLAVFRNIRSLYYASATSESPIEAVVPLILRNIHELWVSIDWKHIDRPSFCNASHLTRTAESTPTLFRIGRTKCIIAGSPRNGLCLASMTACVCARTADETCRFRPNIGNTLGSLGTHLLLIGIVDNTSSSHWEDRFRTSRGATGASSLKQNRTACQERSLQLRAVTPLNIVC